MRRDEVEMRRRRALAVLLPFLALAAAGPGGNALSRAGPAEASAKAAAAPPSFSNDIRPLFQAKCVRCHGGKATRGGLDLTTPAGAVKGGESGPVIVPGRPDDSLLYEKVHS